MKKIIFVFLVFFSFYHTASLHAAQTGTDPQLLKVVDAPWDFGKIVKGNLRKRKFKLKNTGKEDIVIEKLHSCCGYEISDISSWEVPPSGETVLTVICDTKRKAIGEDEKYLTIIIHDKDNTKIEVPVYAQVLKSAKPLENEVPEMVPFDLYKLIASGKDVIMIDVREEPEYKYKYIAGAVNLPRSQVDVHDAEYKNALGAYNAYTTVIAMCGSGTRSSYITKKLSGEGYNVFNLKGGVNAWEREGYPLIYGEKVPLSKEPIAMDIEEAYEHYFSLFKDNVIWIDARSQTEYEKGHIKGAVNISVVDVNDKINAVPKEKNLVIYCSGEGCGESRAVGMLFIEKGFKQPKVRVLRQGYKDWKDAGYPVEE